MDDTKKPICVRVCRCKLKSVFKISELTRAESSCRDAHQQVRGPCDGRWYGCSKGALNNITNDLAPYWVHRRVGLEGEKKKTQTAKGTMSLKNCLPVRCELWEIQVKVVEETVGWLTAATDHIVPLIVRKPALPPARLSGRHCSGELEWTSQHRCYLRKHRWCHYLPVVWSRKAKKRSLHKSFNKLWWDESWWSGRAGRTSVLSVDSVAAI